MVFFSNEGRDGKTHMVFWCLFAFITTGFEHSVANMTLLAAALFVSDSVGVSLTGFAYNLIWVTVGNFIGGTLLVAFPYWYIAKKG
ncbi:formate/nitrite transporter family protein [Anaerospora sp.]|uniref:formate/nitrite transporter family protein n=1 Tax=Anaerospora sp. TaxID=1960278 RepID=UPI00289D3C71|nr:formate/nitrite transporter family protein [Anaerospora sp.]